MIERRIGGSAELLSSGVELLASTLSGLTVLLALRGAVLLALRGAVLGLALRGAVLRLALRGAVLGLALRGAVLGLALRGAVLGLTLRGRLGGSVLLSESCGALVASVLVNRAFEFLIRRGDRVVRGLLDRCRSLGRFPGCGLLRGNRGFSGGRLGGDDPVLGQPLPQRRVQRRVGCDVGAQVRTRGCDVREVLRSQRRIAHVSSGKLRRIDGAHLYSSRTRKCTS